MNPMTKTPKTLTDAEIAAIAADFGIVDIDADTASKIEKTRRLTPRSVYQVHITRSGEWWAIEVPEFPGTRSQAKRLDQVEAMAREAIALMIGVDETSFDVEIHGAGENPRR